VVQEDLQILLRGLPDRMGYICGSYHGNAGFQDEFLVPDDHGSCTGYHIKALMILVDAIRYDILFIIKVVVHGPVTIAGRFCFPEEIPGMAAGIFNDFLTFLGKYFLHTNPSCLPSALCVLEKTVFPKSAVYIFNISLIY